MSNQDQILRAVALLTGIKNNVPKGLVEERWVKEYHLALAKAESAMNFVLTEFRVEGSAINNVIASSNYITGETTYSDDRFCESKILLQKIDSLLEYLKLLLAPAPAPEKIIGFQP